jgi:carbonic anhydrase
MPYCENAMLSCMDFRIQEPVNDWIARQGYTGDIDRIVFGGACKHPDLAIQFLKISYDDHRVRNIVLAQHEDCGAYGGHAAFSSLEEEHRVILGDMRALKEKVAATYPEARITTLLVRQVGDSWEITEVD